MYRIENKYNLFFVWKFWNGLLFFSVENNILHTGSKVLNRANNTFALHCFNQGQKSYFDAFGGVGEWLSR
jgi:hypothetical protein